MNPYKNTKSVVTQLRHDVTNAKAKLVFGWPSLHDTVRDQQNGFLPVS